MGSDHHSSSTTDENVDETDQLTCAVCGTSIDRSEWHPVRARTDDEGQFHIDVFCSMACRMDHSRD